MPSAILNALSLYVHICQRGAQVQSKLMSREYFPRTLGFTMIVSGFAGYSCMTLVQKYKYNNRNDNVAQRKQYLNVMEHNFGAVRFPEDDFDSQQDSNDKVNHTNLDFVKRRSLDRRSTVKSFLSKHQDSRKVLFSSTA